MTGILSKKITRRLIVSLVFGLLALSVFLLAKTYVHLFEGGSVNYYLNEYGALSKSLRTNSPLDYDSFRGWRRGPLDFLWIYPFAKVLGDELPKEWIYVLQLLIIFLIVWKAVQLYWRKGQPVWWACAFALVVLSATSTRYRLMMADINSLIGFSLLPLIAFRYLIGDRPWMAGAVIACAAHFRVLSVALIPYFFIRDRKTILPAFITTVCILFVGTIFLGPRHGYLYWITMFNDVIFSEPGKKAFVDTHEIISVPGVFVKVWGGFRFNEIYAVSLEPSTIRRLMNAALVAQVIAILALLGFVLTNKIYEQKNSVSEMGKRHLRVLEIGCLSTLTYFLSPEYGSDFSLTLFPLFLSGIYALFHLSGYLGRLGAFGLIAGWVLTLNIVGPVAVCRVFFLPQIHQWLGNPMKMKCYELTNGYLLPTLGLFLTLLILWRISSKYKCSLTD